MNIHVDTVIRMTINKSKMYKESSRSKINSKTDQDNPDITITILLLVI